MGNAIVNGGLPGGEQLISLSRRPARTTFFVALPPAGRHHNVDRYRSPCGAPATRGC
jgi:hypothetical protein